jgi:hypothetical protein
VKEAARHAHLPQNGADSGSRYGYSRLGEGFEIGLGLEIDSENHIPHHKGLQIVNLNDFLKDEKIRYRIKGTKNLENIIDCSFDEKNQGSEQTRIFSLSNGEMIVTDKRVIFVEPTERGFFDSLLSKPIVAVIHSIPIDNPGIQSILGVWGKHNTTKVPRIKRSRKTVWNW